MNRPEPGRCERLEPGLRRILAPNPSAMTFRGTNTYLVGEGAVALVDPGPDLPAHRAAILAALGPRETIAAILVTHAHRDHSGLARALARETGALVHAFGGAAGDGVTAELGFGTGGSDAQVVSTASDGTKGGGMREGGMEGGGTEGVDAKGDRPAGDAARGADTGDVGTSGVGPRTPATTGFDPTIFGPGGEGIDPAFAPDLLLQDGAVLEGEGWRLEAIHTPGHASDHLCLALGDICLTGDHVMGWSSSLVSPPDGEMAAYRASLARLAARDWRRFHPGHGAPVENPAARLEALRRHREARGTAILRALGGGPATLAALTASVYADTDPALHGVAARNLLAHLLELAGRAEVAVEDGVFRLR